MDSLIMPGLGSTPIRAAHRLPGWQKTVVYGCGWVLLLTGALWLAVHYSIGAGAGELPHPVEAGCMRLHAIAAFAALFVFGALAADHIPRGWRLSRRYRWARQQTSGMAMCIGMALLIFTGYLLYYFASEATRPAIGWIHSIVGALLAVVLAGHRRRAPGSP